MTERIRDAARQPRRKRATAEFRLLLGVMKTDVLPLRGARKANACPTVGTLINNDNFPREDMKVVSVATSDSRAYYSILSRLKETNLRFVSLTPSQAAHEAPDPAITTKSELGLFSVVSIPIEELDENPLIMEGQILSKTLSESKRVILIGVDPGTRIGVVIIYGGLELGSFTVNSIDSLQWKIVSAVRNIPHARVIIK